MQLDNTLLPPSAAPLRHNDLVIAKKKQKSASHATSESFTSLEPGDLVDEKEAAAILNAAVRTLRNWRSLGRGPPYLKIGQRLVRYHRAELAAFVAGDAIQSPNKAA